MAQSNIQSLIQNLTGVHTQGQAFVPSAVNNGNPNTIYNVPQTPFIPPAPVVTNNPTNKGFIPPTTNGFGSWAVNPNPPAPPAPAASLNWQQLDAHAPGVGAPSGFAGWGDLSQAGKGWVAGTPAPTPPGGTPTPPVGTPPGGVNTGGNLPPQQGTGLGINPNDPRVRPGSGAGFGLLGLPPGTMSTYFTNSPGNGAVSTKDLGSMFGQLGSLNIDLGQVGQGLAGTALGNAIGITQSGTFNLAQALDWVVPGNVYMAQTGQWNAANIIPALFNAINPILGFGVAKLMDYFGAKYSNIDDSKLNWLQKMLKNRYNKNQANKNAGRRGNLGGGDREGWSGFGGGGWMGGYGGFGGDFGNSHTPTIIIGGNGPGEIGDVGSGGNNTPVPVDTNQE